MKLTGGVQNDILRMKDQDMKVLAELLLDIRNLLEKISEKRNR